MASCLIFYLSQFIGSRRVVCKDRLDSHVIKNTLWIYLIESYTLSHPTYRYKYSFNMGMETDPS